jgi:hypothetical protein
VGPEDLRLNSLDRFTKTSPRLVLEEHSGCEVPAGCGGVVLRWVNPAAGLPVLLDFFHAVPATLAVDGVTMTTSSLLLAPGRHVLSLEFPEPVADDTALLLLVGRLRLASPSRNVDQVIVRSVADRSWVFTTSAPPAGWATDPALRLRSRKPLVSRPIVAPAEYTPGWYAYRRTTREGGGEPLGVPPGQARGPIHVRTVFTVPVLTRR